LHAVSGHLADGSSTLSSTSVTALMIPAGTRARSRHLSSWCRGSTRAIDVVLIATKPAKAVSSNVSVPFSHSLLLRMRRISTATTGTAATARARGTRRGASELGSATVVGNRLPLHVALSPCISAQLLQQRCNGRVVALPGDTFPLVVSGGRWQARTADLLLVSHPATSAVRNPHKHARTPNGSEREPSSYRLTGWAHIELVPALGDTAGELPREQRPGPFGPGSGPGHALA